MLDQIIVFTVLFLSLLLFMWERWRYDLVALLALMAIAVAGVIPAGLVFSGFGHPAVITVAAVLVVSRGLRNSGVVGLLSRPLSRVGDRPSAQVGVLSTLVAALSAFMNNVGALALMLPVAIRLARKGKRSPSPLLMPLAFGSLLGGLVTLIGTPPNIIIATFRTDAGLEPFRMFDFTPVGLGVALAGLLFIWLIGWRMVPKRRGAATREELFEISGYFTEVGVPKESKLVGKRLKDIGSLTDAEAVVVALVRDDLLQPGPSSFEVLRAGDVLIIEAGPDDLQELGHSAGLQLSGSRPIKEEELKANGQISLIEAIVMADSQMVNQTARLLNLRRRYGVNLLGVARMGSRIRRRLRNIRFQVGDVLLLQGSTESFAETLSALGCLPLAGRGLILGQPRRAGLGFAIFFLALLPAALGLLPIEVAFVGAAIAMVLARILSLREAYESIDWSIIVLLGAMIPVGHALEISGGAHLIAQGTLSVAGHLAPAVSVTIVMVATILLSNVVNNAAAAVLMAPIAMAVAGGLGVSVDPFLMSVAIGASCAFLTPIGHQSNTLVMGPGGYRFGDYWRMGLVLEIIVVVVGVPLILWFWPM